MSCHGATCIGKGKSAADAFAELTKGKVIAVKNGTVGYEWYFKTPYTEDGYWVTIGG